MAPDRGSPTTSSLSSVSSQAHDITLQASRSITQEPIGCEPDPEFLAMRAAENHFTLRALVCGLIIGVLIAFSNTYFGLQTGWISGMAMPSALIGFAYFKGLKTLLGERFGLGLGFSEVENVLVQTVAGSVGTMPLGCGFVGVVPALEFLLKPNETPESNSSDLEIITALEIAQETGGLRLPLGKLVLWALGLCFFGVVFAVPLRREVIVREKLKFPSGTATALMIGVMHGGEKKENGDVKRRKRSGEDEENQALITDVSRRTSSTNGQENNDREDKIKRDWKKQIRLLTASFGVSGLYTLLSYFAPQLHSIPIFGTYLANTWLWDLNPSPAYVGQGIIMGPATTIHMLIGAVLGWAVLSPIAKSQGWAKGDVGDWNTGSKGWIVWISLAIMLADAIVSLGWLILRPTIWYTRNYGPGMLASLKQRGIKQFLRDMSNAETRGYSPVNLNDDANTDEPDHSLNRTKSAASGHLDEDEEVDAPPEHLIGMKTTLIGLVLTLAFCIFAVQYSFAGIIPIGLTIVALILALLLSIMGVRALGETDLNPVSGISKLTQLVFAVITPRDSPNAVVINLIAGAISESGALQAGDLLQDLKTGHLLGASPKAQFYGQLIGSAVGAVVSAAVYKLYTHVYKIPGGLFQVPTGYVWIFTARLVTGQGLPVHVPEAATIAAILWSILTAVRIYGNSIRRADGTKGAWWVPYIPGGIAVAVGMYNTPSFTLARTAGGVLAWWWTGWKGKAETPVIVLASGLILGEGLVSIVNLGLASAHVPHL
ncbi:oligopeptide transporter-like protein [Acrodontium crateriforme]|uniref:Oligopeptide transporter-like protein n=1 Tax=Acrodontium crateriforme TaxID=150365 RepID=A0AAQ3R3S7_9PEZI|nr:oligopeptide transporter-like protein [Acrodontium crateriforme]